MRIVTRHAPASALVEQYLAGSPDETDLFGGGHPSDPGAWRSRIAEVDRHFDRAKRERLAGLLSGGGDEASRRRSRFVEHEGLAITTGQQPGLLAGPLFSLYKALTAAALADHLQDRLGRPVLPVFWMATQDHDWEEVRRTHLPDLDNELRTVELELPVDMPPHPFHAVRFDRALRDARQDLLACLPDSDFASTFRELLERTHADDRSLPDAEADLLESLLAEAGVFLFRPEQPDAARAALPVLMDEIHHAEGREHALERRGTEIRAAGHDLQVALLERGVNVFLQGDRGRRRLFRTEQDTFGTRHGDLEFTAEELESIGNESPERLSPNVLLRPVVESVLIPTVCYVAGPGESAYFPQTAPLFAARDRSPPIVHPRLSAFLVESKVDKVLDKFGLAIEELAQPHHELAGRIARDEIPAPIRSSMGSLRGEIARRTRELAESMAELDSTLKGTVDGVRNQSFSAMDDLEKKVTQAVKRENEIALEQLDKAQLHLYPGGTAQERMLSPFYYLFRYGSDLITRLRSAADDVLVLPSELGSGTDHADRAPTGAESRR